MTSNQVSRGEVRGVVNFGLDTLKASISDHYVKCIKST